MKKGKQLVLVGLLAMSLAIIPSLSAKAGVAWKGGDWETNYYSMKGGYGAYSNFYHKTKNHYSVAQIHNRETAKDVKQLTHASKGYRSYAKVGPIRVPGGNMRYADVK